MTLPSTSVSLRRSQLYGHERNRAAIDIKERLSRSHVLGNDGSLQPVSADDVNDGSDAQPSWLTSTSRDFRVTLWRNWKKKTIIRDAVRTFVCSFHNLWWVATIHFRFECKRDALEYNTMTSQILQNLSLSDFALMLIYDVFVATFFMFCIWSMFYFFSDREISSKG